MQPGGPVPTARPFGAVKSHRCIFATLRATCAGHRVQVTGRFCGLVADFRLTPRTPFDSFAQRGEHLAIALAR